MAPTQLLTSLNTYVHSNAKSAGKMSGSPLIESYQIGF